MSSNRLRLHADQENQHKVGPAKNDLRIPASDENAMGGSIPSKRPLSAKGNVNEKRSRIPLGGKDQNKILPGLQRSKSSLQLTFSIAPVKQQQPQNIQRDAHLAKPTLKKSKLSLEFSNRPSKAPNPAQTIPRPRSTNPHKNDLLPPEHLHRSKDLVPQFSSDSVIKGPSKILAPVSNSLANTFSDLTASLHVSNQKFEELFARNVDPMKKGARDIGLELLIEALAEDETSIETIPERPQAMVDDDVPLGASPLTKMEAPYLYEAPPKQKMASTFDSDLGFFSGDEEIGENEAAQNITFRDELNASETNNTLGLTEAELKDLLDF